MPCLQGQSRSSLLSSFADTCLRHQRNPVRKCPDVCSTLACHSPGLFDFSPCTGKEGGGMAGSYSCSSLRCILLGLFFFLTPRRQIMPGFSRNLAPAHGLPLGRYEGITADCKVVPSRFVSSQLGPSSFRCIHAWRLFVMNILRPNRLVHSTKCPT